MSVITIGAVASVHPLDPLTAAEVERAWEILEGVIDEWSGHPGDYPNYEAGSWGPAEADSLKP